MGDQELTTKLKPLHTFPRDYSVFRFVVRSGNVSSVVSVVCLENKPSACRFSRRSSNGSTLHPSG